jgi:hypothetical protein
MPGIWPHREDEPPAPSIWPSVLIGGPIFAIAAFMLIWGALVLAAWLGVAI